MNKPAWMAGIAILMGVLLDKMGYSAFTSEFYGVLGLMIAYGWATSRS